jgi:hypothetical protein
MFKKKRAIILACMALILLAGCTWLDNRAYYAEHPTSAEDILKVWGEPYHIETLEDGSFKWYHYYPFDKETWTTNQRLIDYHPGTIYFIIKDNRVVDSGTGGY